MYIFNKSVCKFVIEKEPRKDCEFYLKVTAINGTIDLLSDMLNSF